MSGHESFTPLLHEELKDIHYAEKQLTKALTQNGDEGIRG